MIDEQVKVHDNLSVELKVGFIARKEQKTNDFALNIWMFIPNSLDINRFTYDKSNFYRDLKSNVRLITPVFELRTLASVDALPLALLRKALETFALLPNDTNRASYEHHLKMFQSILKSALREEIKRIRQSDTSAMAHLIELYCHDVRSISDRFRELKSLIDVDSVKKPLREYYLFADEFMSNMIEFQTFQLIKKLRSNAPGLFGDFKETLLSIVRDETEHRKQMGYILVEKGFEKNNHELINRMGLLKKYIESHLYLNIRKRKDGFLAEQFFLSLAAGISMIFATAVAFSFQLRYGSFTMPLFVALVISYMLKDRIKEMTRYYFAHKMGARSFDHKATMSINQNEIGWAREGIGFIPESKIPPEIVKARNCTSIIEANNRAGSEKVLLYRTQMHIDREKLNLDSEFITRGVNSIIRFNFSEFIRNMDNPEFNLYYPNEEDGFEMIEGEKLYYLNFIIQKKEDDQTETKRYRIALNRRGIKKIQLFEEAPVKELKF